MTCVGVRIHISSGTYSTTSLKRVVKSTSSCSSWCQAGIPYRLGMSLQPPATSLQIQPYWRNSEVSPAHLGYTCLMYINIYIRCSRSCRLCPGQASVLLISGRKKTNCIRSWHWCSFSSPKFFFSKLQSISSCSFSTNHRKLSSSNTALFCKECS